MKSCPLSPGTGSPFYEAVLAMLDILVWHFCFSYVKVPIDKMISMRIHGIDAKFIRKMSD